MYVSAAFGQAYEQLHKYDLAEDNYKAFLKMAETFPAEYIHGEFTSAFV